MSHALGVHLLCFPTPSSENQGPGRVPALDMGVSEGLRPRAWCLAHYHRGENLVLPWSVLPVPSLPPKALGGPGEAHRGCWLWVPFFLSPMHW